MSATYIHFIQLVGWLNNNNKNDTRESFEMIRECVLDVMVFAIASIRK